MALGINMFYSALRAKDQEQNNNINTNYMLKRNTDLDYIRGQQRGMGMPAMPSMTSLTNTRTTSTQKPGMFAKGTSKVAKKPMMTFKEALKKHK